MGVPKFFRWLSERYPRINQRYTALPKAATSQQYFRQPPLPPLAAPDPTSQCGLPPDIDRLYLDMNGIIHGCSHNNEDDENAAQDEATKEEGGDETAAEVPVGLSDEEICRNVCYYLDRVVDEMAEPQELLYMAIDGVAPRAKLNQQRSRRYRSGTEGSIEMSLYDAHIAQEEEMERERRLQEEEEAFEGNAEEYGSHRGISSTSSQSTTLSNDIDPGVREVSPGRFQGKIQRSSQKISVTPSAGEDDASQTKTEVIDPDNMPFHSINITPGTPFFQTFTEYLEHFVKYKMTTDPKWKRLTVIFSGPDVPGEGEHKIMQFIREQREREDYNPNLKHCIMGQDGDWMMLTLAAHEPNMVILREQIVFDGARRKLASKKAADQKKDDQTAAVASLGKYIFNPHFEFLHVGILRDYLAFEFETSNVVHSAPWDLERTVDDFVFMTFFVGNDFLPHMPALDIGDHAFDLLFYTYKQCRALWLKEYKEKKKAGTLNPDGSDLPYLTNSGEISSGARLEQFLSRVGSHEEIYYDKKKLLASKMNEKMRRDSKRMKGTINIPDDHIIESKEESDRAAYREMLTSSVESANDISEEDLVLSEKLEFEPTADDDEIDGNIFSSMGKLLKDSLSGEANDDKGLALVGIDDQDLKGRYYYDKFNFTPFDSEKHTDLRKAYVEGLVWNLKYYYEGCVSWEWFYPYHYGPMLSDLKGIDQMLKEISFEGRLGKPLRPFEQLLGCMPPSHARNLPEPYRGFMTDESSPISDFYPKSFTVDMNGKRWPWEAVALLPFIDSDRLIEAAQSVDESKLSDSEKKRNSLGDASIWTHDGSVSTSVPAIGSGHSFGAIEECHAKSIPFGESEWKYTGDKKPVLTAALKPDVEFPQPGYGSLRDGMVEKLSRKFMGVNVFGFRSPYKTACLNIIPEPTLNGSLESLAAEMIGSYTYINYPFFQEAFVTAVSNERGTIRGEKEFKEWELKERPGWILKRDAFIRQFKYGAGLSGTGGISIPENPPITVSVRPFKDIITLEDGTKMKSYARFEIEVPLSLARINPDYEDPRISNLPKAPELNQYHGFPSMQSHVDQSKKKHKSLFPPMGAKSSLATRIRNRNSEKKVSASQFHSMAPNGAQTRSMHGYAYDTPAAAFASMQQNVARRVRPTILPYDRAAVPAVRAPSHVIQKAGVRGRVVAAGAVAMALFFNSANASHVGSSSFGLAESSTASTFNNLASTSTDLNRSVLDRNLFGLRGGNAQFSPDEQSDVPPLEFLHGTTTLSFTFKDGIIVAVDSRASMGQFVGSKTVQKVLVINSHMLGTMAGGAADCQFFLRLIQGEAALHELNEGGRRMSVARASRLLSNLLYENRRVGLSVGTMIMGFDQDGPASIYYVDNSGKRIGGDMFSVGSGSTYALGILDTERRYDMTEDEAVELGIKAIRHATFRDAFSGGYINVYVISKEGWRKVFAGDLARNIDA